MNALKIFRDYPHLSIDEIAELVKKECQKLKEAIFSVMPEECFLKKWNALDPRMIFMVSPEMVKKKMVGPKDICALCSIEACPLNKVDNKNLRNIKVELLGRLYNR